ncbi:ATP-dependent RNA helicase DOB1 [Mytilus galloprovincialis]|uniref:Exosome RNA helicase MTR4 n=1 Tax=Mytilus galloprovincialis TaxID=29158 RepID=A0A8B6GNI6_MYTGA|nr:ATP-dependent RNA helicase DOB1 [Mytilus galloprovincialis]
MAEDFGEDLFNVFDQNEVTKVSPLDTPIVDKSDEQRTDNLLQSIVGTKRPATSVDVEEENEEPKTKKIKNLPDDTGSTEVMPRIQVHTVETAEACLHEVALPPDAEFVPLTKMPDTLAKEYPFILDPFQKEALLCLENNQSVLVSAHTSAGKTVVAVYAIAMSLQQKQRVIYTTPIKALSNQKYRELYEEFQDVGLMTGDVTINPTASCLIMTTEILRSMLYRGSEIMREVAWVIFDEIHYMRDKERGVVWEETIILLPDNVHYVFLSATIPNARQFAEWICHLHKQPCHVVYTDYRPTPLQHYIFPAGGDGIHLVVDENGEFREENFNTAMSVLRDSGDAAKGDQRGRRGGFKDNESNCYKIIKMIMERNFAPVIVFSFSKKDCEAYALQMSKLDFNTEEEKGLVDEVFNNAIDALSDEDKKLPQVEAVLPLLRKGIGIHHGGLLPLLKETIEILFSEGLLKALFATETFAMGLNMPARTVLFTSARKFDGKDFRWVTSGEYIQMSGRAGRRGIDDRGIVILMVDEKMSPQAGKQIVKGLPDYLNSAFHLTYNMVLNLLRVEEINPEYMLERSFYQFQNYAAIPDLFDKLRKLEVKYGAIEVPNEDQVSAYYKIRQQLDNLGNDLLTFIQKPNYLLPFLQPGRLVKIKNGEDDFGWTVVVNIQKKANQTKNTPDTGPVYVAEVLAHLTKECARSRNSANIKPCPAGEKGEMQVIPVLSHLIQQISAVRLYIPQDLRPLDNRQSVLKSIQEVEKRFPDGVPLIDPIEDMGIKEKGLKECVKKIEAFEHRMYSHPLHKDPKLTELYKLFERKAKVGAEIKNIKTELKKKKSLLQMDELKCRKRVLRRLGYCTASDVIEMKGRVACEISSGDELLMTELLFNGVFNDLSVQQCCALVSCFVFDEKANEMPKLTETLSGPLRIMQDTARRIARVSREAKIDVDEEQYVESFRPHMMDIVNAWCNGCTFGQICKMTEVFEGSIIRCMRRLEETLRQMCQASKAIGNTELENKFAEGIRRIKRDIVFAASLYL